MDSPTPEQIAAMEARGWTWDQRRRAFDATTPSSPIFGTVRLVGDGWYAVYGGECVDGGGIKHVDPLAAADEAEAWLRGVLSAFRFPWLRVEVSDG